MSTKWHKAFNVIGAFKPGNTDEESYSSEEEIAQVRGGTEKRRRHKPLPATPPHRSSTSTSLNQGNYQPTPRPRFQPGYPSDPGFYDGQQTTGIYAPTQAKDTNQVTHMHLRGQNNRPEATVNKVKVPQVNVVRRVLGSTHRMSNP
ncbi:MAG: hypothetical protein M1827_000123 [Pycnora praestabilis]|nr:MAG: hypothetical protein M1827_000123 [Pycnora praestabilis]